MKMMTRHLGCLLASLALASTASATDVDINLGDSFEGLIRNSSDEDRLNFTDLENTLVDASLQSKDGLIPTLRIWDVGAMQFLDLSGAISGEGTSKVRLKKFPLPSTGDFQFVIGSGGVTEGNGGGTAGTYQIKTKRKDDKENKKSRSEDALTNGGDTFVKMFDAVGGSRLDATVKATSNPKWQPTIDQLLDPNLNPIDLTGLVIEGNGRAQIKKLNLPNITGAYSLRVASRDGSSGPFRLDVKLKAPKSKEKLIEPASPVIGPVAGDGFETGNIDIDFLLVSFDNMPADINAFYEDPANPGTFNPATLTSTSTTTGLATSQAGEQHMLTWQARRDLGGQMVSGVVFRIEVVNGGMDDSDPFDVNTLGTFIELGAGTTSARTHHSSNLLPNGDLLIAGGEGAAAGSSHEIGDFSAGGVNGTFAETQASLVTSRMNHTSATLPASANDRVVLVGGEDPLGSGLPLPTSEYFDPLTGTFTATGGNTTSRNNSATSAAANDEVYTFGNTDAGVTSNTGEGLDNTQAAWTALANTMMFERNGATATRLIGGRILVAGGSFASGVTGEIFDPATGTFTAVGSMVTDRAHHRATSLVDGRVLITGGQDTNGDPIDAAEIFSPGTNTFLAATENMDTARDGHTSVRLPDGNVLVIGGATDNTGALTGTIEMFRPGTDDFTPAGELNVARADHTSNVLPDGRVVVVGGDDGQTAPEAAVTSVEIRLTANGADNTPPSVGGITNPGASTGNVTIPFMLVDGQSHRAEITVRWRVTGGDWAQATAAGGSGLAALSTSPGGDAHDFVWDSLGDTGVAFNNTVEVEITPFGAVPGTGATTSFTVTN